MEISYDDFIRTTVPRHMQRVQKIFMKMYEKGDIYKGSYEGWYCVPCESYWTESQIGEQKLCPDCGRPVVKAEEEAYFFKLSQFGPQLKELLLDPERCFLEPKSRVNEMINNFIKPGLQDLCVSRTSFKWGIPVTFDPNHVVYVWVDALSNYITVLGYPEKDDIEREAKGRVNSDREEVETESNKNHTNFNTEWKKFLMNY